MLRSMLPVLAFCLLAPRLALLAICPAEVRIGVGGSFSSSFSLAQRRQRWPAFSSALECDPKCVPTNRPRIAGRGFSG
jgi:hypothetical protein